MSVSFKSNGFTDLSLNSLSYCLTTLNKSAIFLIELASGTDEEELFPSCPPAGSIFIDLRFRGQGMCYLSYLKQLPHLL